MAGIGIDFVHQITYNIAAKQSAAFPSPANFNNYANLANTDLYNYYNDERAKLLFKVKAGETLQIPSSLSPFVVNEATLTNNGGVIAQPVNYRYDLDMTANGVDVKKVDFDRRTVYLNSTIDQPSAEFPIYLETGSSFLVYPPDTDPCLLTYLKDPNEVKWAYTLVNNRPVYDPTPSVDFEWGMPELIRLTSRVLVYMGLSIRDEVLQQEANRMEVTAS